MQQRTIQTQSQASVLATNKVLKNTYMLLAMTLAFSALVAAAVVTLNLPSPGFIITLVGVYGLMYLTEKNRNNSMGILFVFMFTGFLGYTVGPLINRYLGAGMGDIVVMAFAGTAFTFFALSAYVLTTKKDMSFLNGMMMAGFVVLLIAMVGNFFLQIPALSLAISAMFILFSSAAILMQTSSIIHGGETSYISATVTIFLSLYNIFVSLLQILGIMGSDD
ncbi:Bax inhibitor-1/YccA family protein [Moritella viscosa]|uniref:SecY stabilizing membrane protein n=1 Tax=Moritella viscosa TaxID=80854 RepID=A0A090IJ79_9GAMM|nr:Bax inhibitor-1/YccA family protein [Moritella viscosa]CED61272.1 membrane protein [Moritella viscosa]SGY88267.1 SecY stabilizing membrane protein [Moritella viscosa]SGY91557.1 SecY stabilizing membrane protein [Moritella viscosa]SGY91629.1 SecY stabilizing membrane protein [Moritella viscosa]SGY95158.1 SecY stabilizing membrane protein [Moritella viscosa]